MIAPGSSIEEARRSLLKAFADAALDSPQADARILLRLVTGLSQTDLALHHARLLTAAESEHLSALAGRRLQREPIARITGEQEFFGLTFRLTQACLVPRADSEVLIEAALRLCPQDTGRVLDLGTGPGTLLLAFLHQRPGWSGTGVDLSPEACATAQDNAGRMGLSARTTILQGTWTAPLTGTFDCILTNPPYIPSATCETLDPEVSHHDPRLALDGGEDGLEAYRHLAGEIPTVLAPGGHVFIEAGIGQANDIARLFVAKGLDHRETRNDLSGIPRCVILQSRPK